MSERVPVAETDEELLAQCEVDTFRSGGPGGQHANKVESAVRLTHTPSGEVVTSRETPSQHRNKSIALAELRKRLVARNKPVKKRKRTRPTLASRKRRLDNKKKRSEKKEMRRPPDV